MGNCIIHTWEDPHNRSNRNHCTTMNLLEFLAMRRPRREDFFLPEEDLVQPLNDEGSNFISKLGYSERWSNFIHWAYMIPWITEWICRFLNKQWLSFNYLKKVRFKKPTKGDIIYTITNEVSEELNESSNVIWEFDDTDWNNYYFYGIEKKRDNRPNECENILSPEIITDGATDRRNNISKKRVGERLQLHDKRKLNIEPYVSQMEENEGYTLATVLDIINLVYREKCESSGVVIWYDNLSINRDKFSPEQLLDWSCIIETQIIGEPRKVKHWMWYKWTFSIIHKDKWEVISGGFSLFEPTEYTQEQKDSLWLT